MCKKHLATLEIQMGYLRQIRVSIILISGLVFFTPIFGADWEIESSDEWVTAAVTGDITHGDRQRFVFNKGNCTAVNHVFSVYTEMPVDFEKLKGAVFSIEFTGALIGAKLSYSMKALSGQVLMFDLGTYDKNFISNQVNTGQKISIRFVDGNGRKASDYFSSPHNEWPTEGIMEAFDRAFATCSS